MKRNLMKVVALGFAVNLILVVMVLGQDLKQIMQEKVAALKQSVAQNQAALQRVGLFADMDRRQADTWIEKTELSLKGEVKNTKIESCQYGPDGKVQKTPLSTPPPPEKKRGLKGKVIEKKVGEMKDYMERAVACARRAGVSRSEESDRDGVPKERARRRQRACQSQPPRG